MHLVLQPNEHSGGMQPMSALIQVRQDQPNTKAPDNGRFYGDFVPVPLFQNIQLLRAAGQRETQTSK